LATVLPPFIDRATAWPGEAFDPNLIWTTDVANYQPPLRQKQYHLCVGFFGI
jgi:hypothetical protein